MSHRVDHFNDPNAPRPNRLVPSASAIVLNDRGELLLVHRSDNDLWSIPGGTMEVGESIADTVVREVKEETGLDVQPRTITGIYSNPSHVVAYPDGEVRQQFSVCFLCQLLGGELRTSDESLEVRFVAPTEIGALNMHPSIRLRIEHFLQRRQQPAIA